MEDFIAAIEYAILVRSVERGLKFGSASFFPTSIMSKQASLYRGAHRSPTLILSACLFACLSVVYTLMLKTVRGRLLLTRDLHRHAGRS